MKGGKGNGDIMDNTNENTNAATAPDPKQSAYDDAQELLSENFDDWAERLKPCGTGEREMPIGDALIHFDRYLARVCRMPLDRRRQLVSSIL